jgi:hypothetical protein
VQEKNLVTVPPLAADIWLLRMMSAEAQKRIRFSSAATTSLSPTRPTR